MNLRHVVVLSGAGISAESGLATFRGAGGLWEGVPVARVATPEAWRADPAEVLRFYNQRRRAVQDAKPNAAHIAIAELEDIFDVTVITQNIDDLHERAGSSNVVHLHGEILKSRGVDDDETTYPCHGELSLGDLSPHGSQLRPHVVWFGEAVPMMARAQRIARDADFFIVVGTSLEVYPAASLVDDVPYDAMKFVVDPNPVGLLCEGFHVVKASATAGIPGIASQLRALMA
jgi:NAD-dependent deacetylase